jgi:hypothetical protein
MPTLWGYLIASPSSAGWTPSSQRRKRLQSGEQLGNTRKYGNAEPNEKRSLDTVDVLLKGALDHDERERLLSEGTRLNGDDALDLMFQALEDMAEPGTTMSGAV